MDMQLDITKDIVYLLLTYPDKSKRIVRTTLNQEILISLGLTLDSDKVNDLDRNVKVDIQKVEDIVMYKDRPELEGVDEFVNRFI